ncbi:MAG: AAA family ATPase [Hyphomicrobium sp.]
MNGSVIAVVNMKGGVGKTTTVVSLSETLAAEENAPVLVIDMDAQASASYCLAGDELLTRLIENDQTVDAYFEDALINGPRKPIEHYICSQVSEVTHLGNNLDVSLLASTAQLRIAEREIIYNLSERGYGLHGIEGQTKTILSHDIEHLRRSYRYIVFDCAPGISAFTAAATALADLVVVPTIPDFLSHLGLVAFTKRVIGEQRDSNALPPYVLVTKKRATKHHDDYVKLIHKMGKQQGAPFRVMDTIIKEMQALPTALEMTGAYPTYSMKYPPVLSDVLTGLTREIREALNGARP